MQKKCKILDNSQHYITLQLTILMLPKQQTRLTKDKPIQMILTNFLKYMLGDEQTEASVF